MMLQRQIVRLKPACVGGSRLALISILLLSGCASLNEARHTIARDQPPDVAPIRQKRNEEVARDFDRNRDDAQFEAAASCWQRGDVEGSQTMLTQLLTRNPNYRRARFVLADIYLFNGDSSRAIDQLRQSLEHDPNDAMAHHALAQVLDASGQRGEALEHYEKAAKLDPKNGVYSLSLHTVQAAARPGAALTSGPPPQALPTNGAKPKVTSVTLTERSMPPTSPRSSPVSTNQKPNSAPLNSHQSNAQQPPARLASVDDWVQPMDLGNNSTESASDSPKATVSVMAPQVAPSSSTPIVAGPVVARPAEAGISQAAAPNSAPGSVTPASYSAAPTKPADRQNQQNPLERAVEAFSHGDTEGAIEWATAGLAQAPQRPAPLYRLLGAAHYRRGEYQAAQIALRQALSLDKSDALSYFLMGSTLSKLGQSELALRYFAEATRLDPRYGS